MVLALVFVVFYLIGLVFTSPAPAPHKGMIDNAERRDVGVAWSNPEYKGNSKFIFEEKNASACEPFDADLVSIKICKTDVECTFFAKKKAHGTNIRHHTGGVSSNDPNCKADPDNYAVAIGCGDAAEIKTDVGTHFDYYTCSSPKKAGPAHAKIETKPHDSSKDMADMASIFG